MHRPSGRDLAESFSKGVERESLGAYFSSRIVQVHPYVDLRLDLRREGHKRKNKSGSQRNRFKDLHFH